MKKVSDYRENAKECRKLAAEMVHAGNRDQLLSMAATWDSLADERARSVELQESRSYSRDWPG